VSECWRGNARFEIWTHGDAEVAIPFRTGHDGVATVHVPITTVENGPHVIVEVASGAKADVWAELDETTVITVVNKPDEGARASSSTFLPTSTSEMPCDSAPNAGWHGMCK
jgi:hypothetical protein